MAYTVAITNQKGGVGKTTTAVNLAAALAIAERRTLLVDADPQGNTTSGVGIAKVELQLSLYDALVEEHPVQDIILSVPGLPHLSLLPATQDLVGAELQLVERPFRESALRRVLEPIEGNYDYIIVDCPPSLGLLTLNVLAAVQALIIPIQCEYYGLEGISQLLNTVRLVQQNINPGLAIGGVLLTMYDSRLNLCRQVAEDATEYFGPKVFGTPIPRNVRLAEAPSFGKPILLYDMQSVGAKSYLAVGQELLRRVEGEHATGMPTGNGTGDHGRSVESPSDEADGSDAGEKSGSAQPPVEQTAEAATEQAAESVAEEPTVATETTAVEEPAAAEKITAVETPEPGTVEAEAAASEMPEPEQNGSTSDADPPVRLGDTPHDDTSGESQVARESHGSAAQPEPTTSSDSPPVAEASDDHASTGESRPSPEPLPGVTT